MELHPLKGQSPRTLKTMKTAQIVENIFFSAWQLWDECKRPKDGNPENVQTSWRAVPATITRDIAYERTKADTYRLVLCARDILANDWSRFLYGAATDDACALSGVSAEMRMLLMLLSLLSLLLRFCYKRSGERRRASWRGRARREHGSWIHIYGQTLEVSFCIWPSWNSTSSRRECSKELSLIQSSERYRLIQWWNNPLYHF